MSEDNQNLCLTQRCPNDIDRTSSTLPQHRPSADTSTEHWPSTATLVRPQLALTLMIGPWPWLLPLVPPQMQPRLQHTLLTKLPGTLLDR